MANVTPVLQTGNDRTGICLKFFYERTVRGQALTIHFWLIKLLRFIHQYCNNIARTMQYFVF